MPFFFTDGTYIVCSGNDICRDKKRESIVVDESENP